MKRLGAVLAVLAVFGLVQIAYGAEGKAPGNRPLFGELTKIEGKTLTVTMRRGDNPPVEQTATVDDKTEYTKEATVELKDVKVGDRVRITQGERTYYGEVAKIEGQTITLKSRRPGAEEQTVTVNAETKIMGPVKIKLEDLKVGMPVMITVEDGKAVRVSVVSSTAMRGPGKRGERSKGKAPGGEQ